MNLKSGFALTNHPSHPKKDRQSTRCAAPSITSVIVFLVFQRWTDLSAPTTLGFVEHVPEGVVDQKLLDTSSNAGTDVVDVPGEVLVPQDGVEDSRNDGNKRDDKDEGS